MNEPVKELLGKRPFGAVADAFTRTFGASFWERVWTIAFVLQFIGTTMDWVKTDCAFFHFSLPVLWGGILVILLFGIYCLCGYSRKELIAISVVLALLGISFLHSDYVSLFRLAVFIFAAKGIPFENICKVGFFCYLFGVASVVALSFLGITTDVVIARTELVGRGTIRHSLGFYTANGLSFFSMMVVVTWLLWRYRQLRAIDFVACLLLTALNFALTNSKVTLCLGLLITIGIMLARHIEDPGKKETLLKILMTCIPCIAIAWMALCLAYDSNSGVQYAINVVSSDRLNLSHMAFDDFGVTPFGQFVVFSLPVDSTFARIPVKFGWVAFIILMLLIAGTVAQAWRNRRLEIMIVLVAYMLHCTMETPSIAVPFSIILFALTANLGNAQSERPNRAD